MIHRAQWVLPISSPPIRDGAVALDDRGRIIAFGRELRGETVEHRGILMPGLVNAHTHLELSHLRVPGGEGLVPWIKQLLRVRQNAAPTVVEAAAQRMVARGTVLAADISNTVGPIAVPGLELLALDERVNPVLPLAPPRAGCVVTPHAPYTCNEDQIRAIVAHTGGQIASIHVEEDECEAAWLTTGEGSFSTLLRTRQVVGRRALAWLEGMGVLGARTLLVHMTFADDEAIAIAAKRRCTAVLCPRSNVHITRTLPPFERLRAAGVRVALGTDSLASSPSLDVLGEVQALARAGADAAWLLEAATRGGASALGFLHLGTLEAGQRPGLIAIGDGAIDDAVAFVAHEGADAPVERVA